MTHTCSSALIRCMDFRLTSAINKWMEEKGIMDDCDVISVAGISKSIAIDPESNESKYLIEQIGLSVKLHDTKTLYLIHHTDCGAYGGHTSFSSLAEEKARYNEDMEKSMAVINGLFPKLEVKLVLADILDSGEIKIYEL